mgnify:CR=1 FL=1
MTPKQQHYENLANTIIKNLEKRHMKGTYFPTGKEASDHIMSLIPKGASVSCGGTMSAEETGLKQALMAREDITGYFRRSDMSPEEIEDIYHKALSCDYYLMSTNGITIDGELFNIDGRGNRTAALIYGPKQVLILCGMNKVAHSLDACIERVRNIASPANCIRLDRNTPCAATGRCADCFSPDTICSQFVYTRHSAVPGRIHVILVGEELGY